MDVERVIVKMMADSTQYTRTMDGTVVTAQRTAANITMAFRGMSSSGASSLGMLGQAASSVGSVFSSILGKAIDFAKYGLIGLIGVAAVAGYHAIQLAADYEQASIAFEVMTGSAEKGKKVLDDITQMAVTTPFTSGQLIETAQQLKSFGIQTDQLIPTMRALGDVAAGGSGGSLDVRMQRLSLAFGQVMTAGRLMGTELRQFNEAGVPLIHYLSEELGVPEQRVKGLVEAGRVSSNAVIGAFNRMTSAGGLFAGMMDRQSETVAGKWSTLKDNIQILLRNVGLAMVSGFGIKGLLDDFANAVQDASGGVGKLEGIFGNLRKVFDAFRAAVMGVGKVLFKQFTSEGGLDWDRIEQIATDVLKGIISWVGKLIDALAKAGVFISENILMPIIKTMEQIGVFENRNAQGEATTIYQALRDRGENRFVSGVAGFGLGIYDEAAGGKYTEGLRQRGVLGQGESAAVTQFKEMAERLKKVDAAGTAEQMIKEMEAYQEQLRKAREATAPIVPLAKEEQERIRKEQMAWAKAYAYQEQKFGQMKADAGGAALGGLGMAGGGQGALYAERYYRESLEKMKGMDEYFAAQKRAKEGAEKMAKKWEISADAMDFANKLQKEMVDGTSALEKFNYTTKLLNEARDKSLGFGALGGGWSPGHGGILSEQEFQYGQYKSFMELRRSLGDRMEVKLPPAALRGSTEAQEIINRTSMQTGNWQDEVLRVMTAAKDAQLEERQTMKEVLEQLKKLNEDDSFELGDIE